MNDLASDRIFGDSNLPPTLTPLSRKTDMLVLPPTLFIEFMSIRMNSSTAATDRIKALASLLAEAEHEDENDDDDDDDWAEEKVISRDNVRERRNNLVQRIPTSSCRAPTNASNQKIMALGRREISAQLKSKTSFEENSPSCVVESTTEATSTSRLSTIQSCANSRRPIVFHATSAVKVQRQWKREQRSSAKTEHHGGDKENEPSVKTTPSADATQIMSVVATSAHLFPPSLRTTPTTTTQDKATAMTFDAATASTSSSSLTAITSSSKQIIFGRPDTFGAAGMGIPESDNNYYMPNVKERAKALSHWKLTKKDKNGYQRALEWKRSCCGGDVDGDDDVEGDEGKSAVQEKSGQRLSFRNNGSCGVGQGQEGKRNEEDTDGYLPNCSGGSGSDNASLAASLTVKKASAPYFLAKFVQSIEDDANDDDGGENPRIEIGDKKSSNTIKMGKRELENTVNGGVPITPRGSGALSPRKNGMLESPRAALSPRNGFVSKSSDTVISQSPKNTMVSKCEKSETKITQHYFPSNVMITKNTSHKLIPKSPRIEVIGGSSRSITTTSTTGKTNKDMSGGAYDLRGHRDLLVHVDREKVKVRLDMDDQWYGTHSDDDVDSENRVEKYDKDVDENEMAISVRLESKHIAEAREIPREVNLNCSSGDEDELDELPIEKAIHPMNSTDSIIEEAVNFLKTPLFDIDIPIEIQQHSDDCEDDTRDQSIRCEEESCESELLIVAERFALSLDRFLVGVDDDDVHVKTAVGGAQKQVLGDRIKSDTLSIAEESDESQVDQCEWVGWVETPRNNDKFVHSSSFSVNFSCDESGRSKSIIDESVLDYDDDGFGALGLPLEAKLVPNTGASEYARKPQKLKIIIDGAPEFTNSNKTVDKEPTFFVASQPSPSCGDDTCLLVPSITATVAVTGKVNMMVGKQSARKLNLKRFLSNDVKLPSVVPSSLFGPLSDDDASATNDSIRFDNNATIFCEQETESTKGKYFIFASNSAASFAKDKSPQNGFVANFENNTLCTGGSISSSESVDCAAPALAMKAKKMLKRMTPFKSKTRKMNAFGSLDDAELD